jgi:ATP-dependent Lon protease
MEDSMYSEIPDANSDQLEHTNALEPVEHQVPDAVYILPLYFKPVFPGIMVPLIFKGEQELRTIQLIHEKSNGFAGLVYAPAKDTSSDDPFPWDIGVAVQIVQTRMIGPDTVQVLVQTFHRFQKVLKMPATTSELWKIKHLPDSLKQLDIEIKAYMLAIGNETKQLIKANQVVQEQLNLVAGQINYNRPGAAMDIVSNILTSDPNQLQELLEALDLRERARLLLKLLKEEVELAMLQQKIHTDIQETVDKQQKEFFLQRQLQAIKKELGLEKDDQEAEIEFLHKKLKRLKLTKAAKAVVEEEMSKLKLLNPQSPEYHVCRNYLEWVTDLPWGKTSEDNQDIASARKLLDADHYGLEDVKDMILEFLSSIIRKGKVAGSVICLVGPPGVGKTSIGQSIASALGRKFFRFSVGGMRDEAEIKGHRRTYIGAMPGKIIQALKRVQVANPVIMLDEIDKIGASFQGDPASALLEVLDPEQNSHFLDHYIDTPFDLSNVLFVTTANQLDTIPSPLMDRMEVIRLSGYILEDKILIASKFLIPKQLKEHNYKPDEIVFEDDALRQIIDRYAREAGVRNLEKQLRKIIRKITLQLAEQKETSLLVRKEDVETFLGKPLFQTELLYTRNNPGMVLGLAYTAYGGSTLYIEAAGIRSGTPGFKQTGQLGKVMQESAEIAYSHIRGRLSDGPESNDYFTQHLVHLHVPAGATPKDGPSAGVTMALSLYSLATGEAVRKDVAMTGELTLTGKVLAVGGIKEKVIAARRVGIKDLILPKDNKNDFDLLPEHIRNSFNVYYADYFDDVVKAAYYPH